ncbi:YjbF family lipoprotein [Primorskyibacter marinus]|uniref:YjbF family lipoprotein n=1 Tax=Primorskyibacter marinus TaxID=1977320 RepID=UPI001300ADEB|nr:YjbF family lipoprotein [Primorskyibacter marinus]
MPRISSVLLALAALIGLASCGNDTAQEQRTEVFKQLVNGTVARSRKTEPPQVTVAQINQALATKAGPLALVTVESRKASALVIQIGQNGHYRTYATEQRQTLNFRGGMITSTRGLGGDLMSSEETALLSLVSRKSGGSAPYTMRFLTGEDVTATSQYTCAVSRDGTAPVKLGAINTVTQKMTAQCTGPDGSFSNTYLVDGAGDIVSTRQWLGTFTGYVAAQQLRK